jgi:hypothetical protein
MLKVTLRQQKQNKKVKQPTLYRSMSQYCLRNPKAFFFFFLICYYFLEVNLHGTWKKKKKGKENF